MDLGGAGWDRSCRENHSARSASIGLIRVARRAGIQVASNAASASSAGAQVNAKGSSGLTW